MQAGATVVLMAITAYYAWQTRNLADLGRKASETQVLQRRRERSESAAMGLLTIVREKTYWVDAGDAPLARELAKRVWEACDAQAPLIDDPELKRRVLTLRPVAFTAGWPDDALTKDGTDRGAVTLKLRDIAERTRWSLEAYLVGDELPSWEGLPEPTDAYAWTVRPL